MALCDSVGHKFDRAKQPPRQKGELTCFSDRQKEIAEGAKRKASEFNWNEKYALAAGKNGWGSSRPFSLFLPSLSLVPQHGFWVRAPPPPLMSEMPS
jgi:hypothetical protein